MADHVALMREAAAKMRERAEKASFGPWSAASDGLVWADRPGDPVSGSEQIEDAEHIASWHPVVALAVADLLEAAAHREEEYLASEPCGRPTGSEGCECGEPEPGDEGALALALARAYLGRPPEVDGG